MAFSLRPLYTLSLDVLTYGPWQIAVSVVQGDTYKINKLSDDIII